MRLSIIKLRFGLSKDVWLDYVGQRAYPVSFKGYASEEASVTTKACSDKGNRRLALNWVQSAGKGVIGVSLADEGSVKQWD